MTRCPHCASRMQRLLTRCPSCRLLHRGLASLPINMVHWYAQVLVKYAVFSGRACGRELWSFVAINTAVLCLLDNGCRQGMFAPAIWHFTLLFLLPPFVTVIIRRAHDFNLRAWWLLMWPLTAVLLLIGSVYLESVVFPLPDDVDPEMLEDSFCVFPVITVILLWPLLLLLFIALLCLPGMWGANRFGPDPRQAFNALTTHDNASTPRK